MPCRDGGPSAYTDENSDLRKRNDELAQMLCSLCRLLEGRKELLVHLPYVIGLEQWWTEHKRIDAARIAQAEAIKAQNALKRQALSKLTHEERKVLGL